MIVKMLTHLHVMVKHLWHCTFAKEAKEAKKGMRCCLWGHRHPYPVHRHPQGGHRLDKAKREVMGWHHHCLSGGTTTPRVVPT
jgi:hypothetical protein